jgi:integrase
MRFLEIFSGISALESNCTFQSRGIKGIKTDDIHREYLTIDELKSLVKTPCKYPVMKNAFLFSCLTRLRWLDINKLKWSEVQKQGDGWRATFRQQKTIMNFFKM